MAINGADVLLLVNTGTVELPTWTAVGSQRDVTFEESTEEIDVSSKDAREKRVLAGRYSSSVTLDALFIPTDTAYTELKDAMRNGDLVQVVRQYDETNVEKASAVVTSLSETFPDQDGATVSVSLTIDGAWSAVV